jgi:hypothetical protein
MQTKQDCTSETKLDHLTLCKNSIPIKIVIANSLRNRTRLSTFYNIT